MGVNHSGIYILMTDQLLHHSQVVTSFQSMSDEAMSERVRRDFLRDARGLDSFAHLFGDHFAGRMPAILTADHARREKPLPAELAIRRFIFDAQSSRQFHQAAADIKITLMQLFPPFQMLANRRNKQAWKD